MGTYNYDIYDELVETLKKIENLGFAFYNRERECWNAASTVVKHCIDKGLNLFNNDIEYLKSLDTRKYFSTRHWIDLANKKIEENPRCEGCGNRANKIWMKDWTLKGEETLDDVWSLCTKCRIEDGEIISHKVVKEQVKKTFETSEEYKKMLEKEVEEMIIKTTRDYLSGKQSREVKSLWVSNGKMK